ncbi:hypothetical protein D3C71_1283430 [compost metagenome]
MLLRTWLHHYRSRFEANGGQVIARLGGIEGVAALRCRHPCGGEVLLQHGNPTALRGDTQVFVLIERILLIFVFAGRVRRATEGVQSEVVAAGVTVLRQLGRLLQLAEQGQFQRGGAFVVDVVVNSNRVMITLEHESLGVDSAVFTGKGQRNAQLFLAFRQGVAVLRRLEQRTFAVCRVIRAVSAGQAALRLINK